MVLRNFELIAKFDLAWMLMQNSSTAHSVSIKCSLFHSSPKTYLTKAPRHTHQKYGHACIYHLLPLTFEYLPFHPGVGKPVQLQPNDSIDTSLSMIQHCSSESPWVNQKHDTLSAANILGLHLSDAPQHQYTTSTQSYMCERYSKSFFLIKTISPNLRKP